MMLKKLLMGIDRQQGIFLMEQILGGKKTNTSIKHNTLQMIR